MTDEESIPDGFAGLFQPWIVQLRTITEGLAGMTGLSESLLPQPVPSLPGLPLPGALFRGAAVHSIASGAAQPAASRRCRLHRPRSTSSSRRWRRLSARSPSGAGHGHSLRGW